MGDHVHHGEYHESPQLLLKDILVFAAWIFLAQSQFPLIALATLGSFLGLQHKIMSSPGCGKR
jgi:hypothetical protein